MRACRIITSSGLSTCLLTAPYQTSRLKNQDGVFSVTAGRF